MTSTMAVHMPVFNELHKHYAFLIESVEVEKVFDTIVDEKNKAIQTFTSYRAGIYSFTSKEKRDSFVSLINRSSTEMEVAFVAMIDPNPDLATSPVVETEKPAK